MPPYNEVLNNSDSSEKATNLYMNSPTPYAPLNINKNEFRCLASSNGGEGGKFYNTNNENFYSNQPSEKFEPKYRYDEKNLYSNIGENVAVPQVPAEGRSSRNAVYSNIETNRPMFSRQVKEKDLVYSNINWNNKLENTYSNIPSVHGNGNFLCSTVSFLYKFPSWQIYLDSRLYLQC